jgi:hypothetical protein
MKMSTTIIPAAPGFYVLKFYSGYLDEFVVEREPVIAWAVIGSDDVESMRCNVITPMETYNSPYDCSILCLDGKLLEQGDDCKRLTYEQWEKEMRADWESKKAATAE